MTVYFVISMVRHEDNTKILSTGTITADEKWQIMKYCIANNILIINLFEISKEEWENINNKEMPVFLHPPEI